MLACNNEEDFEMRHPVTAAAVRDPREREGAILSNSIRLAFHGAAGTVTGSKHLFSVGKTNILLDAGMFQGRKKLRLRNWESPGFDCKSIDHVLLSHTHIDHVGYLPRLVKLGLTAPVHMTPAAFELAELMLLDAAKIQEEDARYANKKGFSKHKPALPLFDAEDAAKALILRRSVPYERWLSLIKGDRIRARFHNSGHLLGAAFIEIEAKLRNQGLRLVYSGDIGRFEMPLHLDPKPLPSCDVLILESTYGQRQHVSTSMLEQVGKPLNKTLGRGGTVLIPAFAVGRSQQVSLMLRRLMRDGSIPQVPIHIDSPMAINATKIYSRFLNRRNLDPDVLEDGRLRLFPEDVHFHRSVQDSIELNNMKGPRIIISASGMLTAGRVLHHLKRLAPDSKNLVMLAGFQAPGTRGRQLTDGKRQVKIHGQYIPVRCQCLSFRGLSGHADRDELLQWVASAPKPPKLVCLVHGETDSAEALAGHLEEQFGCQTFIPQQHDEIDLLEELKKADPPRPKRRKSAAAKAQPSKPTKRPSPIPPRHCQPLPDSRPKSATLDAAAPERVEALMESASYRLPNADLALLQRAELRGVRLQLEYTKAQLLQVEHGVRSTIVVFGGTRVIEQKDAQQKLEAARQALTQEPQNHNLKRQVSIRERVLAKCRYYDEARRLGQLVSKAGGGPEDNRLMVVTGGGPGIMEAGNRGAHDVGAESLGLNITLPHEQYPNPYITPDLCFQFRYFGMRKMHFLMRAKALVAFPGGYGTLDELFETLCLIQTRKVRPLPVFLVGESFWRGVFDAEFLAAEGVIDPEDVDLFQFAETAEQVWAGIVDWYEQTEASLFD